MFLLEPTISGMPAGLPSPPWWGGYAVVSSLKNNHVPVPGLTLPGMPAALPTLPWWEGSTVVYSLKNSHVTAHSPPHQECRQRFLLRRIGGEERIRSGLPREK